MSRLGQVTREMAVYFGLIEEFDEDYRRPPARARVTVGLRWVAAILGLVLVVALLVEILS